jgi:4-methylaminobutanoate oxidase (formaldehyde-forming)
MSAPSLPERARIVIVGGGVIGTSIAYHLGLLGVTDVLLLEKDELTSGTTWHAAGLITSGGYHTESSLWIARYSRDLYSRLEAETGHSTGFRPVGHIVTACTPHHQELIRRERDFQVHFGVPNELISAREVAELFPLAKTTDILEASYVSDEGRADPVGITMSLAKGAKSRGAMLLEGVTVTGFIRSGDRVTGVMTDAGDVECETVVLAAGLWTRQLAAAVNVNVPLQAAEHYYAFTEPIEGVHRDLPIIEDPTSFGYYREEAGGLMCGIFEPVAAAWNAREAPNDFVFGTIPPDYDRVMPFMDAAMERIPALQTAGIRTFFCGPESFTHDNTPMLGPVPEVDGMFVAAGMNSMGIMCAGGVGSVLASWIVDGVAPLDLVSYAVDRTVAFENTLKFRAERVTEQVGLWVAPSFPTFEQRTARNIRRSPLHEVWKARGAHFSMGHGWELPNWFSLSGQIPEMPWTFGTGEWTSWIAQEHDAVRTAVGVGDVTSMSKFYVQGPDASVVLERLSANAVPGDIGRIVYTQWLNISGGIEADLTITRLSDEKFLIAVSDISHRRVQKMIRNEVAPNERVVVTDVTSTMAVLTVQGPRSRELLSRVSPDDLSEVAFPYLTAKEIEVGYSRVLALRVTYLGELGFELYIPWDQAVSVWQVLEEAGEDLGLRPIGLAAMEGLRLEKGFREYGVDIENTDTPITAGLGFAVAWDKPGGFIGRQALIGSRGQYPSRIVSVLLHDSAPLLHGSEPVYRDGVYIGYVNAGAFGHTLGASVGLASVDCPDGVTSEWLSTGSIEVEIAGVRYGATASIRPFYDPDRTRVRG